MVMVLNALSISAPVAPEYSPYHMFTQGNFFDNEQTRKVVSPDVVSHRGMTLDQLGHLLASYSVKVKVYHGADISLEEFRKLAIENLKTSNSFVVVNFLRKAIGEEKGGAYFPFSCL